MISPAIYLLALLALGYAEGDRDAGIIMGLSRTQGVINHRGRWRFRAGLALALALVFVPFLPHWWHALLLLPIAAGAFNIAFRWTLNTRRNLRCDYVSLSNAYDSVFIAIAGVHAGAIAYAIEALLVLAPMIAIYLTRT